MSRVTGMWRWALQYMSGLVIQAKTLFMATITLHSAQTSALMIMLIKPQTATNKLFDELLVVALLKVDNSAQMIDRQT